METKIVNKQGELTKELKDVNAFLFEGNDAVESSTIIIDDEPVDNLLHFRYNTFSPIMGENNISMFIEPNDKIFNVLARTDDFDGRQIGTSLSFIGEDYDKFIDLMRKIIEYEDNKA
jgi:hypothetical protein